MHSHPTVEKAFEEFSEVGRLAVVVELKLRLLTGKFPRIQDYAHSKSIAELETALLPYLIEKQLITDGEKLRLELSRKIRNKIFHCEFESAGKFIEELNGTPMAHGAVSGAKLDEVPGSNMLEKILGFVNAVQTGQQMKGVFKVDDATTKNAGTFGWLLNALTKGVFHEGQKAAKESITALDRVFGVVAKQEYEQGKNGS